MKYSLNGRVRFSEIDAQGKLTIPGLVNYLQDCCTFQSEDIGLGIDVLKENNRAWFINSWQIKINKLPVMGDEIVVKTWPYSFKGFYGFRNFTIEDMAGKTMVEVNSLWIYMDTETLRPTRLEPETVEAYGNDDQLAGEWASRKIKLQDGMENGSEFTVQKMHLDTNQHMNNGKYIEAAQECLPEDVTIKEIRTEYKKAAQLGDIIYMKSQSQGDTTQVALCDQADDVYAIVEFKR